MEKKEIVLRFIEHFCAGNVNELASLLADDFTLHGPLYQFDSKKAYLQSLSQEGLEKGRHQVIEVNEEGGEVCVRYDYIKADSTVRVFQRFFVEGGKIAKTNLEF